jgi:hypothetical protein
MTGGGRELILLRSLAESDLGIFAAHRRAATSKQRAIGLTTPVARRLLDPRINNEGGAELDCICIFGDVANRERRHIGKVGKNWRLGGRQLTGRAFASLDSKDFLLLRSVEGNDGTTPVLITFVGRKSQHILHAGVAATLGNSLSQSVALVLHGSREFAWLGALFPSIPPDLAVGPAAAGPKLI